MVPACAPGIYRCCAACRITLGRLALLCASMRRGDSYVCACQLHHCCTAHLSQRVGQVDGRGGLAHASLAAGHGDDVAHLGQTTRPCIVCSDGRHRLRGDGHVDAAHPWQLLHGAGGAAASVPADQLV
jgi:hypothetical protein